MLAKMHDLLTVVWSISMELPVLHAAIIVSLNFGCINGTKLDKYARLKQFKIIRGLGGGCVCGKCDVIRRGGQNSLNLCGVIYERSPTCTP